MDKKLIGLVAVFIMVFGVFMTTLLYSGRERSGPVRAGLPPSCVNSFIFTTSVEAAVGESVNQLIYVRDDNNNGLKGINVACSTTLGSLNPFSGVTNTNGNLQLTLTSNTAGLAVTNCTIPICGQVQRSVSVQFNSQ
ncbi:hypothetical protein A3C23_03870 [Candidatus Roizmanbacteria bacterium RIFCSPHIGHO2_02_FULL_37_13b]|uniref:Big-1 domain-containing protein n=1 Tax=Candidatus Roizmanbacteria bacterium RIFCSPLOWO2_02_FULL_36_11 TaxID=1802071 RepID=A0A1F7JC18_9BACT|nr:MAG: hypothetical protein A3C23_03870 [Candidatus Roizmanbacteria bacterium RIFCSPHIGHO2_02_FULL_37_13b]OGK53168.1 MAG: hypothetical protein A3H78_06170 [Candidatus Roizmanbacteria bacterium RIFCSPLOWO2_02_FULL_36_11]